MACSSMIKGSYANEPQLRVRDFLLIILEL